MTIEKYQEEKEILRNLNKRESLWGMLIATLIGIFPTLAIFYAAPELFVSILGWVIPGVVLGGFVKLAISAHSIKLRLIPAGLIFLLGPLLLFVTGNPFTFFIGLMNMFIVITITRPRLSKDQERALWLQRQGKLQP
ncbi:hypothetical protein [uncultured Microbulbifer sp.]|uniref:hypothetical protein n=1 Tax=uncultured Microbulbifer sp. TaxID=348147 RepID=UPI002637172B|nr:hypothetical protein [uncultured Microbulbifer sp.]